MGGFFLAAALGLNLSAAKAGTSWTDRLDLNAILETEAAVETRDGDLQKWDFVAEPKLEADLGGLGKLTGVGRLRVDPADELEPGQPAGQDTVRGPVSRRAFIGDTADLELRELYLDAFVGPAFLRLGKQQIVWGQADGLRVLDVVNPFHFREFILPDFEDRRIPLWSLNAEIPIGAWTAQLLWIPDHTYADVPGDGATFEITSPRIVPRPPPGFAGPVTVEAPERPNDMIEDDDYGARMTAFLGGWDLSVNYLYHYADQPVFFRRAAPSGGIRIDPEYRRTHLLGGSFSNAFGDFTLRGELGYSTDRFFLTRDSSDADGVFESGELGSVFGLDYQYDADLLISGQVFTSVLEEHPDGAVRDRVDSQLTLLAQRQLYHDTLTLETLAIHGINDGDGLVQAEAAYELRGNLILTLGLDVFYGDRRGLFAQFDDADRITLGIELGL